MATSRIAVYLRQSKDPVLEFEAVSRQRELIREGIFPKYADWDWDSRREFVDNDTSASKNIRRPQYEAMVEAVEAGEFDYVVAWNLDRLTRRPRQIEDWIEFYQNGKTTLATSEGIDLSTEAGQFHLRVMAGAARMEVDRKARRQVEANASRRKKGEPPVGRRAFGYTLASAGHEVIEEEADLIRQGVQALLAGASLRSIANSWNETPHRTTDGMSWSASSVRGVIGNPRYAALNPPPRPTPKADGDKWVSSSRADRFNLSEMTAGTWEEVISVKTWAAVNAVLRSPSRRSSPLGAPVKRLLSAGVSICGRCGAPMKAGATAAGVHTYRCSARGHLVRAAWSAEEFVSAAIVDRLSQPDATTLVTTSGDDEAERGKLAADLVDIASRRQTQIDLFNAGGILTAQEYAASLRELTKLQDAVQARIEELNGSHAAAELLSTDDLAGTWEKLSVDKRRLVILSLCEVVMFSPGKGRRAANVGDSIRLVWHVDRLSETDRARLGAILSGVVVGVTQTYDLPIRRKVAQAVQLLPTSVARGLPGADLLPIQPLSTGHKVSIPEASRHRREIVAAFNLLPKETKDALVVALANMT